MRNTAVSAGIRRYRLYRPHRGRLASGFGADGVQPTDAGHGYLAAKIALALSELLD